MGSPKSPTSPRWPMVTLNLDGSPREMRADLWRLVVGVGTPSPGVQIFLGIDPTQSLNWDTLDQLPQLKELTYYGSDRGIEQYVARRASITTLTLGKFGRSAIRLDGSHVQHLMLSLANEPLRVALPPSATRLNLYGEMRKYDQVAVDAAGRGAGLELTCAGDEVIAGLEEAAGLRCSGTVELAKLRSYRALEGLELIGCKSVNGLAELRYFTRLARLRLQECYQLDSEALPTAEELPSLRSVRIDGIRRRDADAFKKKLGKVAKLEVRGIRTDAWVQKNADSPFRDWADDVDAAIGKSALAIYAKAFSALSKSDAASSPEQVKAIFQQFVAALNRLAKKHPFDSIMRENVADAVDLLAKKVTADIDAKELHRWLDAEENF